MRASQSGSTSATVSLSRSPGQVRSNSPHTNSSGRRSSLSLASGPTAGAWEAWGQAGLVTAGAQRILAGPAGRLQEQRRRCIKAQSLMVIDGACVWIPAALDRQPRMCRTCCGMAGCTACPAQPAAAHHLPLASPTKADCRAPESVGGEAPAFCLGGGGAGCRQAGSSSGRGHNGWLTCRGGSLPSSMHKVRRVARWQALLNAICHASSVTAGCEHSRL